MNRIMLMASLFLATFVCSINISAQSNPTDEDSKQQEEYLRRLENIQSDEERMDSLYQWCRITLNSSCELTLLQKLLVLSEANHHESYRLHSLRNIMRCQYNLDYPTDSLLASYGKIAALNLNSKEYFRVLADAKSYLAFQYIFEGDFMKVYDLANEMLKDFAEVDNYGLMKANEILSHSYSEIFQDKKALQYAKKAFEISKNIGDDYSEALYLCLSVCSFLNNLNQHEDMLTYTDELSQLIEKEKTRKTDRELDYYRSMQHAYAINYYISKNDLEQAWEEVKETQKYENVELDGIDTQLRNMMIARYYVASGRPETAWSYISEIDSIAPLLYLQEQSNVLHQIGRDAEAYEWESYISQRISWAFEMTYAKELSEMETRLKLFNVQEDKNRILMWSIIIGSIAALIIFGLVIYLYLQQKKHAKRFASANNTQKVFLQNMSHELRTPLNAICGFSQLLTDKQTRELLKEEEIQQYGDIIRCNTDMLSTLVNDILDASDMESGKYHIFLNDCHPNEICRKAIQTISYRCPGNVKLYFTTEVDDDYTMYSDAQRVQQIIINYLTNAMKHTSEGEIHVHCSTTENNGLITFSVTDTGVGIPPEKAEVIFNRFEKLNVFHEGTGLGLAICRQLATLLGGEVKLDKSYTNGARFVCILPKKSPEI